MNNINDVDLTEGTKLILYADDILLYRKLDTDQDHTALQQDVDSLGACVESS